MFKCWHKFFVVPLLVLSLIALSMPMREIWAAPQVPIPTPEPSPPHDVVTENGVSRSAEAASVHTEAVQQEDVMGEDVSKRDTFSKEFVLKNGMRARMISSTPLHYQQGARWEAYDNTLQEIKQNGKTQKWVNKKNPTRIELPAGVSQAEEIVLARDGKRVALQLQGVQQGKGQGAQKRMENALAKGLGSAQKKMQQQDKSKAGMRYSNVWKDIDIEYELVGEALKENIILQKKQQKNLTLRYRLNLEGLRPQVEKDGSILLFDSAQKQEDAAPVFVLPAPWMIDQQGETSYDIAVALTPKTQRALTLQQGGDNLQDDAQEDQPQDNLQEEPQTNAPQAQQPSGETEQDPSQQEEPVPQDPTPLFSGTAGTGRSAAAGRICANGSPAICASGGNHRAAAARRQSRTDGCDGAGPRAAGRGRRAAAGYAAAGCACWHGAGGCTAAGAVSRRHLGDCLHPAGRVAARFRARLSGCDRSGHHGQPLRRQCA